MELNYDVQIQRKRLEDMCVGPKGYGMLMVWDKGYSAVPILKVDTNGPMQKVFDAHKIEKDDLDVETRWCLLKESNEPVSEYMTLALEIEWPELETQVSLMFPLSEHRILLQLLKEASEYGLAPAGAPLKLDSSLFLEGINDDLLAAVLEVMKK